MRVVNGLDTLIRDFSAFAARSENIYAKTPTASVAYGAKHLSKTRFVPKKRKYGHCVRLRISHRYLISHELSEYYDMPYYGLYADKVEGLTVNGFSVVPRDGETRPLHNLP